MENDELNNNNLPENAENEENNIVKLQDEEGNDVYFEFLDFIEYNGENYAVLLPVDDNSENADEVVILKEDTDSETDDEENEAYVTVDDEKVLNEVFDIFKEKFKDEFDFDEE